MNKSLIISIVACVIAVAAIVVAFVVAGKDGTNGIDGINGTNGVDGVTPTIEISDDGYWIINGTKTEYVAIGKDGANGVDGVTPTIEISNDGYWVINGEKSNVKADVEKLENKNPQELDFYLQDDGTYWVAAGKAKYLSNIVIPETYNGKAVTGIAKEGFMDCEELVSITIPDSVTSIGEDAFDNTSIESVYYTGDVAGWLGITFDSAESNPTGNVTNLYFNNVLVTEIVIPNSVTSIGDYAFRGCDSLISVEIPNSVTSIGNSAFSNCSSLARINIPDSVTSIGNLAFNNCRPLASIEIPDSVTSIGDSAFNMCTSLTSIIIPKSVTSVGGKVFSWCSSSLTVYCEAQSKPEGWSSTWDNSSPYDEHNFKIDGVVWGYTGE